MLLFYFCLLQKYFVPHPDTFSLLVFSRALMMGYHFLKSGVVCVHFLKPIQFWPVAVRLSRQGIIWGCWNLSDRDHLVISFTLLDNSNFVCLPTSSACKELLLRLNWKFESPLNLTPKIFCLYYALLLQ